MKLTTTKTDLIELYWVQEKTLEQIAIQFRVTRGAVWQRMRKLAIPRRIGSYIIGHTVSPETRRKIGIASQGRSPTFGMKGHKHSDDTKRGWSERRKGIPKQEETRRRMSQAMRLQWSQGHRKKPSLETKQKISASLKAHTPIYPWWLAGYWTGRKHSPETCKKMCQIWEERRQNQDKMAQWVMATQRQPNQGEQFLDTLLNKHFPGEWKYTGDGKDGTQIGGRIPDWLNVNGRKAVVELFGEPWHLEPSRTFEATKKHYEKYGFICIIIWYRELRTKASRQSLIVELQRCLSEP